VIGEGTLSLVNVSSSGSNISVVSTGDLTVAGGGVVASPGTVDLTSAAISSIPARSAIRAPPR